MPIAALLLVLTAAVLHAGYNLAIKRAEEKNIFTWLAMAAGSLIFLPVLLLQQPLPARIWPYAAVSALFEAAYFLTLVQAYRLGDFSLVYPVIRGAAPAFLALLAFIFLKERPSHAGWLGLGVLLIGLLVVSAGGVVGKLMANPGAAPLAALTVALVGAVWISIYSTIDGAAVHLASPSAYTVLALNLTWIFTAPVILIHYGKNRVVDVARREWRLLLVIGFLMVFTYTLVLIAFSIGHVSYAGALRESSVVLGALAGWLWLGESFGPLRTAGAALIFTGILIIAILG